MMLVQDNPMLKGDRGLNWFICQVYDTMCEAAVCQTAHGVAEPHIEAWHRRKYGMVASEGAGVP